MTGLIRTMALTAASAIAIGIAAGPAFAQEIPVSCRGNVTADSIECGDGADTTGDDTTAYGDGALATDVNSTSIGSGALASAAPRSRSAAAASPRAT